MRGAEVECDNIDRESEKMSCHVPSLSTPNIRYPFANGQCCNRKVGWCSLFDVVLKDKALLPLVVHAILDRTSSSYCLYSCCTCCELSFCALHLLKHHSHYSCSVLRASLDLDHLFLRRYIVILQTNENENPFSSKKSFAIVA
ncbi:hypothetical protein M3J09_002418 [Ascochyta lentis]